MQVYDIDLKPCQVTDSTDYPSWQGSYIRDQLYQIDMDCNICLLDISLIDMWANIIPQSTATNINNSNIDLVCVMLCDHPNNFPIAGTMEEMPNVYALTSLITKPMVFIVWDYFKEISHQQIKYPVWASLCASEKSCSNLSVDTTHKKYLYSSITNIIQPERVINLIELQKANYYNRTLAVFNAPTEYQLSGDVWQWKLRQLYGYNPVYVNRLTNEILPILPINTALALDDIVLTNNIISKNVVFDYSNAAYSNSYVNIIAEHSYKHKFISEKTIKPLLAKQFFVMISGKGTISMLKELGIDTYDDIIDHSRYDHSNDKVRIQDVHKLLHDMQHYNWEQIYKDTVERREKNRQLLLDLTFEKTFLLELEQMITTIIKPIN